MASARGPDAAPSRITVLLGDPRLPYAYNRSGRFEAQDFAAVRRLEAALGELGDYDFELLDDHARWSERLSQGRPGLVLNFCNTGFRNRVFQQLHVPALLETLELPYIGAGPACMALCHDKGMVLSLAGECGIPMPRQRYARLSGDALPRVERYPALIKPNFSDGSLGVEADALVRDEAEARRCLGRLAEQFDRPGVLIQDYLPGPEYSVALVGNPDTGFERLPPVEIDFSALGEGLPPILTYASKVDPGSPYWRRIGLRRARAPEALDERLQGRCRALFERLGCRDYARFDFRCDAEGEARLIDVNGHPMWGEGGMMATMAEHAGWGYAGLLRRIIEAGRRRLGSAG